MYTNTCYSIVTCMCGLFDSSRLSYFIVWYSFVCFSFFFFFKQKTAYEMRISDWSSDVCSSDLLGRNGLVAAAEQDHGIHRLRRDHLLNVHRHEIAIEHAGRIEEGLAERDRRKLDRQPAGRDDAALRRLDQFREMPMAVEIGRASCRERECQYV